MKPNYLMALMFGMASMSAFAESNPSVNVWLKTGAKVSYALTEKPVVRNSGESIIFATSTVTIELAKADVQRFTFEDTEAVNTLTLKKGWNWMSHNVADPLPPMMFDKATRVVSQTQEAMNDEVIGFVGNLETLSNTSLYKVNMSALKKYTLSGTPSTDVEIALNEGWNWVGYPATAKADLAEALGAMQATEDDQIWGQDAFATYSEGAWAGTLTLLEPGKGYMIKAAKAQTIKYGEAATTAGAKSRQYVRISAPESSASAFTYDAYAYPNTMNIIATLAAGGKTLSVSDYTVGAFSEGECRGVGRVVNDKLYITVHGNANESISFTAIDSENQQTESTSTLTFKSELVGSAKSPYVINLGETTAIQQVTARPQTDGMVRIYNTSGALVKTTAGQLDSDPFLFINDLPQGVYIVKSGTVSFKITKK